MRASSAVWLLVLVTLSGCVAEVVEKRKPRKGPVAEVGYVDPGGGDVRYSTEGWGWIVSMRRSTALRKMRRVCKPKDLEAKVIDEFSRDDVDASYVGGEMADEMAKGLQHYNVAPYRHIVFICRLKDKPLTKPGDKK